MYICFNFVLLVNWIIAYYFGHNFMWILFLDNLNCIGLCFFRLLKWTYDLLDWESYTIFYDFFEVEEDCYIFVQKPIRNQFSLF